MGREGKGWAGGGGGGGETSFRGKVRENAECLDKSFDTYTRTADHCQADTERERQTDRD